MANEDKKDFNAMLQNAKDMPKYQRITDQASILSPFLPGLVIKGQRIKPPSGGL